MIARNHKIFALLVAIVMMLACAPTLAPATASVPTFDPNSVGTVIAQTAGAASTQTALMAPPTLTPTVPPTSTSVPTETPTATFIFILPTMTVPPTFIQPGSSGDDYECQIISQNPINNTVIQHTSVFDARWMVVNVGKLSWDSNNADYRYTSGTKMHRTGAFDFAQSIPPGGMYEFVVAMQAPDEPGTYTTTWKITTGKARFCSMSITIVVN
ncbi:MAG: hypothetical protein IPL71_23490 [Anaerolineales bacterium]|uniref:NBR1-Ig-like domain-containing protein n=1 Tax=Candidatus Villigracilis proximus TaxID=3140683 RepID=UPI003135C638|nr:hypothetical protein [Anaerolineales bacterium]